MRPSSSRLNKHNELIRSLQQQVSAKERELADQKWLFEQFLQSPSWRLTYPIRWLAKHFRALSAWVNGSDAHQGPPVDALPLTTESDPVTSVDLVQEHKDFFTTLQKTQLHAVLASQTKLALPHNVDPEVSIILVLFNRAELTLACLRSLQEHGSLRLEVIIVDNASTDATSTLLERIEGARIIRNKENANFLLAVNQAAKEARGDYLLLLNNDAQLLPGSLESAIATMKSAPDIGAVGGRILLLDGTLQEAGSIVWRDGSCIGYGRSDDPFASMYMFRRDVDYCSGAFLLTPRTVWNQLGGFDEAFVPAYYEETDYCARLWEQGFRVVYEPNAVVVHYEFASSESMKAATDLQREHQALFAKRHARFLAERDLAGHDSILVARMRPNRQGRLLFLDDRVPHQWFGSGYPRSQAILLSFRQRGFFVTFYPLDVVTEEWDSVYSDMPRDVEFMMGLGRPMLEAFMRNRQGYYDTIFVSRPHNMNLLRPILISNPTWFDNVHIIYDAEALFASRDITLGKLKGTPLSEEDERRIVREEVELASAAACVISVSEHERSMFEKYGIDRVHVLGHTLSVSPTPRSFEQRAGFLFVGAIYEEASPNGDSVIWFLTEILPKIQSGLGQNVSFTIAGVNRSERIRSLAGPSIHVIGHVKDLWDVYNAARVFVAPTRYAAGIPHKVHEAAARGVPVVATPLLALQLGWEDGSPFAVGADTDSFAAKCVELYTNKGTWTQFREAGLERVRAECSDEVFEERLTAILNAQRVRFADVGMDR